jgi:hypothetical protein
MIEIVEVEEGRTDEGLPLYTPTIRFYNPSNPSVFTDDLSPVSFTSEKEMRDAVFVSNLAAIALSPLKLRQEKVQKELLVIMMEAVSSDDDDRSKELKREATLKIEELADLEDGMGKAVSEATNTAMELLIFEEEELKVGDGTTYDFRTNMTKH